MQCRSRADCLPVAGQSHERLHAMEPIPWTAQSCHPILQKWHLSLLQNRNRPSSPAQNSHRSPLSPCSCPWERSTAPHCVGMAFSHARSPAIFANVANDLWTKVCWSPTSVLHTPWCPNCHPCIVFETNNQILAYLSIYLGLRIYHDVPRPHAIIDPTFRSFSLGASRDTYSCVTHDSRWSSSGNWPLVTRKVEIRRWWSSWINLGSKSVEKYHKTMFRSTWMVLTSQKSQKSWIVWSCIQNIPKHQKKHTQNNIKHIKQNIIYIIYIFIYHL